MFTIHIRNLRLQASIGIYSFELEKQPILVTLEAHYDYSTMPTAKTPTSTVCYDSLLEATVDHFDNVHYDWLEEAIDCLHAALFRQFPQIKQVSIAVGKAQVAHFVQADEVTVSATFTRS